MAKKYRVFCPGVTVMLSLTVFMNIVSELMPITSDAVPLIGTYFNFIMGMVGGRMIILTNSNNLDSRFSN